MKLLIFILLFPMIGLAQTDSILVSKSSIINAAKTIKMQRDSIAELNLLINELHKANDIQSIMFSQNETEQELMLKRVNIADGIINRYSDHLKKDKWYNSSVMYYLGGWCSAYISSLIYKNTR